MSGRAATRPRALTYTMIDYDRIAAEYAKNREVHPRVLSSLIATSNIKRDSMVLEVGCGTGNYIIALESITGSTCFGVDPSREMLKRAKERSDKVTFEKGAAHELGSEKFDLIFSVDVIHHVEDQAGYFKEAFQALKPSGRVCTVTDSEEIIKSRLLAKYFPDTIEVDLSRYPRISELRELIEQAEFIEITEETVEFSFDLPDIQAYRDQAFSCLHLISQDAFHQGIERMEEDFREGPIKNVSRYLLVWGKKIKGKSFDS